MAYGLRTAKFRMELDGVQVEFEIESSDTAALNMNDIISAMREAGTLGFKAPKRWSADMKQEDLVGKKGTVQSVKVDPKSEKRFNVLIMTDDAVPVTIMAFHAKEFRARDRVEIIKNEKGYISAVILDENDQKIIPF